MLSFKNAAMSSGLYSGTEPRWLVQTNAADFFSGGADSDTNVDFKAAEGDTRDNA